MRRPSTVGPSVALVAALLLAGCSASPDASPQTPATTAPTPGPDPTPAPEPTPEPPAPPPPPAPPEEPRRPSSPECPTEVRSAIAAPVATQLAAFAQDDLDAAYAVTSPFFQQVIGRTAFEDLIRDDYPELIGNDGHRFDECQVLGRRGFILVGVRAGAQETVLRYDLSEEPDGWRIDGAIRVQGITLPPEQLA